MKQNEIKIYDEIEVIYPRINNNQKLCLVFESHLSNIEIEVSKELLSKVLDNYPELFIKDQPK